MRTFAGRRNRGTSMVELLVVIVIFLIGILAVVQIFPGGLTILRTTRSNTIANQLARAEMERLRGRAEQLPENIIPVTFTVGGGRVNFVADPDRAPENFGPAGIQLRRDSQVINAGGEAIGPWPYVSGPNVSRRVIGEGGKVPGPRAVGNQFGSLLVLQFAPIVYNADATYAGLLSVYGNNLNRRGGSPWDNGNASRRPFQYFVDDAEDAAATLYLPRDRVNNREYLFSFTAWIDNGGTVERRSLVDISITVPPDVNGGYFVQPIAPLVVGNFVGADYDSIQVARKYREVASFSGEAYEYQLLDATFGTILINPLAAAAEEQRANGTRIPMAARVNYDVYDWRIIRDEFRIASANPPQQKLILNNLYNPTKITPDGTAWAGMNITGQPDFLILDMDTGGIIQRDSYTIATSPGLLTFIDVDNDPSNGTQLNLRLPGAVTDVQVSAAGRFVRALYMAVNEWSVQVTKAAARYNVNIGRPGLAQYYPTGAAEYYGTGGGLVGALPTRIYFPPMDDGKKVTIGEIWYGVSGSEPNLLADQDFLIRSTPADPTGLPYIDIADVLGGAAEPLNFSRYGYATKNVKGASVTVRVAWNPATFKLIEDPDENIRSFEKWMQNWRRTSSTSFLVKEVQ